MAAIKNRSITTPQVAACLLALGADPGIVAPDGSSALSVALASCISWQSVVFSRVLMRSGRRTWYAAKLHGIDRLRQTLQASLIIGQLHLFLKAPKGLEPNMCRLYGLSLRWHRMLSTELEAWYEEQLLLEQQKVSGKGGSVLQRGAQPAQQRVSTDNLPAVRGSCIWSGCWADLAEYVKP